MDALKTITRRIEDGFVLNEQGRWIYMAEQRIYERRVIDELANGNVLVDGEWVSIGEARRRSRAVEPKIPAKKPAAQPAAKAPPARTAAPAPIAPPAPIAAPAPIARLAPITPPAPRISVPKSAAPTPPPPITPLTPPQPDMASFEAMGDMLETVCIDMTTPAMVKAMEAARTKNPGTVNPKGFPK